MRADYCVEAVTDWQHAGQGVQETRIPDNVLRITRHKARGIETEVFGPHGTGAHAAEEWVDVESVVATAHVLVETARAWCR